MSRIPARETDEPTAQMIEAGARRLRQFNREWDDAEEVAAAIYRVMNQAAAPLMAKCRAYTSHTTPRCGRSGL